MDASLAQQAMDRLAAEHAALLQRVTAANTDFEQRMQALGLSIYYDPADDCFMLLLGGAGPAANVEVDDTLHYRLDPDTLKIVGFEIPSLTLFASRHPTRAGAVRQLASRAGQHPGTYLRVPHSEAATVQAEARELVAV